MPKRVEKRDYHADYPELHVPECHVHEWQELDASVEKRHVGNRENECADKGN